ncbi:hypothetical protein GIY23_03645 [Allosaccharopolyspora coralli]|uniref:Uncharacterized protein n=1 Tax=Allosaccharopolyspora coralli TaxID=2665642 RepID=A0A5Q3Q2R6_9PSEU|nr:hypothetical protein [Allosaccharopolyspora coralli]QGK68762.1 hypothetical protein GIY23_03645 [Allosaccharopolyspora coralli]
MERLYLDHGLPPSFQISPAAHPLELDHVLAERGYELSGATTIAGVTTFGPLRGKS